MLAYAIALGVNFFLASSRADRILGVGVIALAVIWNVVLFFPEIRRLTITHPKGSQLESPFWLYMFGIVALGMVVFACTVTYRSMVHEPELLTSEEFAQPYIHGKYFRIADLADANNVIQGRSFEDCYIYGPAVLYPTEYTDLQTSTFDATSEAAFLPVGPNAIGGGATGVILLKDCKFRRCHFIKIAFAGTSEEVEKWRHQKPQ